LIFGAPLSPLKSVKFVAVVWEGELCLQSTARDNITFHAFPLDNEAARLSFVVWIVDVISDPIESFRSALVGLNIHGPPQILWLVFDHFIFSIIWCRLPLFFPQDCVPRRQLQELRPAIVISISLPVSSASLAVWLGRLFL